MALSLYNFTPHKFLETMISLFEVFISATDDIMILCTQPLYKSIETVINMLFDASFDIPYIYWLDVPLLDVVFGSMLPTIVTLLIVLWVVKQVLDFLP